MTESMLPLEPTDTTWLPLPTAGLPAHARQSPSPRRMQLWALVLTAREVPCRLQQDEAGWSLLIPPERLEQALAELRMFEEENRHWPPPLLATAPLADNTLTTVAVLVLLATFHNLTQLDLNLLQHQPVPWIELGNAHVAAIRQGQWWRLVTALTLHADWLHLLGNLGIGGICLVRLGRDLGSGLAWCMVLASGLLGNLLNAWVQLPNHRAVGASTAVFGCVGILAALSLVRHRTRLQRHWPLPVAAALGLLALLGSEGERTDLGAHLFGLGAGLGLGLLTALLYRQRRRPGPLVNALLALAAAFTVAGAWLAALWSS